MSSKKLTVDSVWAQVVSVLEEHNTEAHKQQRTTLDATAFRKAIEEGEQALTLSALRELTWENLKKAGGLPTAMAKAVARIFRATSQDVRAEERESDGQERGRSSSRRARRSLIALQFASPAELVSDYDPAVPYSPTARQLGRMNPQGKPFLVFNRDGTLNREASTRVLEEVLKNDPVREYLQVGANKLRVYRIGEGPGDLRQIHPLFGTQLRGDGMGVEDDLLWGALGEDVLATLLIAVNETKEIVVKEFSSDKFKLSQLFATLKGGGIESLGAIAPRAFELFDERSQIGGLPATKTRLSNRNPKQVVGRGDPASHFLPRR